MADKKISQLTAVTTPLAGTEVLPIVQGGDTKKVTALELTGVNVTADGRVGVGGVPNTTVNGSLITAKFGVHQDGGSINYPVVGAVKYSDVTSTAGVTICGARSRGSKATPTAVADGDLLLSHIAAGYDGTDFAISSRINYEVDGTPGNDDMPGRIVFLTAADGSQTPTERARIGANGNLVLTNNLDFVGGGATVRIHLSGGTPVDSNTGIAAAWNVHSDYRLKENVTTIEDALKKVSAINPVMFTWKDEQNGKQTAGFIAHELAEYAPYAVLGEKDAVNQDGSLKAQCIDYGKVVPLLTAAIQEQQRIITALTTRVSALEGE